ncbi:CU044_5270 family protein [Actinomadura miaoliensis]|uniref:CU044_5270 family protein n=1 Tax=Actinomadura miaoliensis TaxID=430685 RepID=A0ABP7VG64_9ACTN
MDEMTVLERFRSEVPRPGTDGLRAEEARLMAAISGAEPAPARRARRGRADGLGRSRGRLAIGLAGGLAAAAIAAGVMAVPDDAPEPGTITHVMPVAASQVLTRAADNATKFPELHPRPGQYLVFESQTMNPVESNSAKGHSRYLARGIRKVWMPVEGDSTQGVIEGRTLAPKPYPGWPIPPEAHQSESSSGPEKLADFDHRAEYLRNDYAYVSRLPTEPQKMYEHLYTRLGTGPQADTEAWQRVGGLLTEAYMPAAQRAALFRAAAAIPGVTTIDEAVDAAGRKGIAAAKTIGGRRHEYIFDRRTYRYLGEREVVTDAAEAEAPVGSVLTSTAQLRVSVADQAPRVNP